MMHNDAIVRQASRGDKVPGDKVQTDYRGWKAKATHGNSDWWGNERQAYRLAGEGHANAEQMGEVGPGVKIGGAVRPVGQVKNNTELPRIKTILNDLNNWEKKRKKWVGH